MLNIDDKSYKPTPEELAKYVQNPLFDELLRYMQAQYNAILSVEYSGDNVLLGWNLKYKKAGKTLCTVYPRQGHFPLLLVVGQKEKAGVEALLPSLSEEFRSVYLTTQEGMGQRWLLFDLSHPSPLYNDVLQVVRIRRESK